jgi:carbamoyltransferase
MGMRVLGLSGMHPGASVALLVDGEVVAFVREENLSGVPQDASLPLRAARVALDLAGLTSADLDAIVFHEKPLRRFERTLVTTLSRFPRGGRAFASEVSRWLGDQLWVRGRLASELGVPPERIRFAEHMRAHAAAALAAARTGDPVRDARPWPVLVLDDVGEWAGCAIATGTPADGSLELHEELHAPATPGLIQGAAAAYLGLDRWHAADRLQDLATHGEPRHLEALRASLPHAEDDAPSLGAGWRLESGEVSMDPAHWSPHLGAPRTPGAPVDPTTDPEAAHLAASVESWLVEAALALGRRALASGGAPRLAVGGLLARRRRLVARLSQELELEELAVAPLPGDDGTALGAALCAIGDRARALPAQLAGGVPLRRDLLDGMAEGHTDDPADALSVLAAGHAVGWMSGRAPATATGQLARLVLRSAAAPDAREELVGQLALGPGWFGLPLLVPEGELARWCPDLGTRAALALTLGVHAEPQGGEDPVPGARLGDGSLWIQAVRAEEEPELHSLLLAHGERTGTAALIAAPLQRDDLTLALGIREGQEAAARRGLERLVVLGDAAGSTAIAAHEQGALAP